MGERIIKSEAEWRAQLSPQQFEVTRSRGTEPPFTGRYWDCHEPGRYRCVCCGLDLFSSEQKYDSGSGWPSFHAPLDAQRIKTRPDAGNGMVRVEVQCARCDAHLGHLFPDGPPPTGERYCINSASLVLLPERSSSGDEPST